MSELHYTSLAFCPDCGKPVIFVDGDAYCDNPKCEFNDNEEDKEDE